MLRSRVNNRKRLRSQREANVMCIFCACVQWRKSLQSIKHRIQRQLLNTIVKGTATKSASGSATPLKEHVFFNVTLLSCSTILPFGERYLCQSSHNLRASIQIFRWNPSTKNNKTKRNEKKRECEEWQKNKAVIYYEMPMTMWCCCLYVSIMMFYWIAIKWHKHTYQEIKKAFHSGGFFVVVVVTALNVTSWVLAKRKKLKNIRIDCDLFALSSLKAWERQWKKSRWHFQCIWSEKKT